MGHSWNLSIWLDALGLRRPDQPELIHAVQPVEILGDHSAFSAPLLVPSAIAGGTVAGAVLTRGSAQLATLAPGGSFVREISLTPDVPTFLKARLTQAPGTQANLVVPLPQNLTATPCQSTLTIGTVGGAHIPATEAQCPGWGSPVVTEIVLTDPFYIRPGWVLEMWTSAANVACEWAISWEDNPAQPSER